MLGSTVGVSVGVAADRVCGSGFDRGCGSECNMYIYLVLQKVSLLQCIGHIIIGCGRGRGSGCGSRRGSGCGSRCGSGFGSLCKMCL